VLLDDHVDPREIDSQLRLHPNYEIGRPGGCEVCVYGWVKFTPYARREDVHRLMELNFACLDGIPVSVKATSSLLLGRNMLQIVRRGIEQDYSSMDKTE
jgi:hypothetical protein